MIFLRTDTVELTQYIDENDPPSYAVLSHMWGPEEVVHEDLVGDRSKAIAKAGFAKIREACRVALEEHQLRYLWIDTCCTDRNDAAELYASINYSFRRFRSAALCIAHLSDFDFDPSSAHPDKETWNIDTSGYRQLLGKSRWFTRSWTIQELIAPSRLLFYSRQWKLFEERSTLVYSLFGFTGIDPYALDGGDLSQIPVARRMLWAASRNATRLEDLAYSLLGLFDVEVAPKYGERDTTAFLRLQEAIVKKFKDPSIFAWRDDWPEKLSTWEECEELVRSGQLRGYLAKSPAYFSHVGHLFPSLGSPNYDKDPVLAAEDANTDNDDWETSSVASFASSTTLVGSSASGPVLSSLNTAIFFLLDNDDLYPLFKTAIQRPSVGLDRLQRNLARLLRQLGKELAVEATTKNESLSAVFLRQYRIPIASAITSRVFDECLRPVLVNPPASLVPDSRGATSSDTATEGRQNDDTETEANYEVVEEERDDQDEPDDMAPSDKEEAADIDFESISVFILKSAAFASFARNLSDFVDPSFRTHASRLVTRVLEGKDTGDLYWSNMRLRMMTTLTELEETRPQRVFLEVMGTQGIMDKVQIWLETTTRETWNWWPLRPPKYPFSLSEARLGWCCRCGKDRWEVVPAEFAGGVAWLLRKFPFYNRGHGTDPPKTNTETVPTGLSSGTTSEYLSIGTKSIKMGSGSNSEPAQSTASNQWNQPNGQQEHPKPRYIFLVATTDRHNFKQVPSLYLSTDDFGQELRQVYRELKGFWRSWFSPYGFSHCDFVRFEKFCRNGFAHRGLEVPTTAQKDYYYTPRPALRDPPVSPEEFNHIYQYTANNASMGSSWTLPFYSCVESLSDDTVGCIPQRYHYLDEKSNRKEDFWGLYIQERRSALMTSSYIVLCLSPFLIFCILYLLGIIQGDVQNATTPLALALTCLGLFLGSMIKA